MKITKTTAASSIGEVALFTLTNNSGASVELSSLGAGIVKVCVPDKDGKIENVAFHMRALRIILPTDHASGKCPAVMPTA